MLLRVEAAQLPLADAGEQALLILVRGEQQPHHCATVGHIDPQQILAHQQIQQGCEARLGQQGLAGQGAEGGGLTQAMEVLPQHGRLEQAPSLGQDGGAG